MGTRYITAARQRELAESPALVFSTSDDVPKPLAPGYASPLVRVAGVGTAPPPELLGSPCGTFLVRVRCAEGGRRNEVGVVNPDGLPSFELSPDGGLSWDRPRRVSCGDEGDAHVDYATVSTPLATVALGLRLSVGPGLYVAGDEFAGSTRPSPDVEALIAVESDHADGYLVGSFGTLLPLTAWGEELEYAVAVGVRWRMIQKAGVAEQLKAYEPDGEFYRRCARGDLTNHPSYRPSLARGTGNAQANFPLVRAPRDPMRGMKI